MCDRDPESSPEPDAPQDPGPAESAPVDPPYEPFETEVVEKDDGQPGETRDQ